MGRFRASVFSVVVAGSFQQKEAPLLVFLDFDGGYMFYSSSCRNAAPQSSCYDIQEYEPFAGPPEMRTGIAKELKNLFLGFNIEFTTSFPFQEEYIHVVFSPISGWRKRNPDRTYIGFTWMDCGNTSYRDVVYVTTSSESREVAELTAHEIAHSLGLPHLLDENSLLFWQQKQKRTAGFLNECVPYEHFRCAPDFLPVCPEGHLNPYQELWRRLGPKSKPTARI